MALADELNECPQSVFQVRGQRARAVPDELFARVIAALRAAPAQEPSAVLVALPSMDKELEWILGRPNFACSGIFRTLRSAGHKIETHAEEEQAASIYWMLGMYFKHGPDKWRDEANKALKEMYAAAAAREGAK